MESIVGDATGIIHLVASLLALLFGTMVLMMRKGTTRHKRTGYYYVAAMVIVIVTAFMIYNLFKGWGLFHYLAVVSLVTVLIGMIAIWIKKPKNTWQYLHFSAMYWSVIGLYAAFVAEVLVRIPKTPFFGMVGIGTGAIVLFGGILFGRNKSKWKKIFAIERK